MTDLTSTPNNPVPSGSSDPTDPEHHESSDSRIDQLESLMATYIDHHLRNPNQDNVVEASLNQFLETALKDLLTEACPKLISITATSYITNPKGGAAGRYRRHMAVYTTFTFTLPTPTDDDWKDMAQSFAAAADWLGYHANDGFYLTWPTITHINPSKLICTVTARYYVPIPDWFIQQIHSR